MPERMWEIRVRKQTIHQRIDFEPHEIPSQVFQRLIQNSKGTDKEIPETQLDPNTGQEVVIKWNFFYRFRGEEFPLNPDLSFEAQNVPPSAVIVVKAPTIRAQTIYIEGFDGLKPEELEAARSKAPIIAGIIALVLLLGGGGYFYFVYLPKAKMLEPYRVNITTEPKGALITLILDIKDVPYLKGKKSGFEYMSLKSPQKNVPIPKQAKLIFAEIKLPGYKKWSVGVPLEKYQKNPKKYKLIPAKELTKPGFFPDELEKLPPPPKFLPVPGPDPTVLEVKFPRRWRRLTLGVDPLHGGKATGAVGIDGTTAASLNWAVSQTLNNVFKKWRRKVRTRLSKRKESDNPPSKRRARFLRAAGAILQLDFKTDGELFKPGKKKEKVGGKEVTYNDAVAGFTIVWSENNAKAAYTQKWAKCLADAMVKAGFRPFQIGDPQNSPDKKTLPKPKLEDALKSAKLNDPVLNGRAPALRVIPGFLSHRAELKAWKDPNTQEAFATAVAQSLICLRK